MNMYSPDILEKKLEDHMNSFLSENAWDFNKSLYHYTSYAGLKGILESRRLWQTDFFSLNDPSEIKHGLKFIEDFFAKRYEKNYAEVKIFIEIFRNMVERGLKLFVTSFCEEGDYLPNWRYYGGAGAGYSIGFKGSYLKPKNEQYKEGARIFSKVFYSYKYENVKTQDIDLIGYINKIFQYADESNKKWYIYLGYPGSVATRLLLLLPIIKNRDYIDEKEWRTVLMSLDNPDGSSDMPLPAQRIIIDSKKIEENESMKFLKPTSNTIVRIETEQFCYSDISEIYVGPRLDFMAAKFGIEKILREAGADECTIKNIKICPSEKSFQ